MQGSISKVIGAGDGCAINAHCSGVAASILMNPLCAMMPPSGESLRREQKEGLADHKDLMRDMIAELCRVSGENADADMGGADTRPSDLTAHFDPKMDRNINLCTGGGDYMVTIV